MYFCRHVLVLIALVLAAVPHPAALAQDPDPRGGLASAVFNFPRDHRMHQDDPAMNEHYIEWLYFTGILRDPASGAVWGYQVTLWQAVIPLFSHGQPLFSYDIALSDLQHSRHIVYRVAPILLKPERFGEIRQEGDTWIYEQPGALTIRHQETQDIWHLEFTGDPGGSNVPNSAGDNSRQPPIHLSADLVNDKSNYYTHMPGGLGQVGACQANRATLDGYTYYYSHPALTTTAAFTVDGQTITLRGDTWFDHQWGNFNTCLLSWNWFSLRLDSGGYLMISQATDLSGNPLPGLILASYIDPASGQRRSWIGSPAVSLTPVRFWTDPATRIVFPLAWEITTPVGRFGIEPAFDAQMMPPVPLPYWEGVITVRDGGLDGKRIGDGYLEIAR